jgi:hypothetical protein
VDTATEVRYAGVTVGRAAHLRDREDRGAFLVFSEPLPVGTSIVLKLEGGEQAARVTKVVESADPNVAGMRLAFLTGAEAQAAKPAVAPAPSAAPAPAPEAAPAPAAPATPTVTVEAPEPAAPMAAAVEPSSGVVSSAAETSASVAPNDSAPTSTGGDPHLERTAVGEATATDAGQSPVPSVPSAPSEGDSGSSGHGKRRRRRR